MNGMGGTVLQSDWGGTSLKLEISSVKSGTVDACEESESEHGRTWVSWVFASVKHNFECDNFMWCDSNCYL